MTDSNEKPSRWQSFAALKRFFRASWWRHTFAFALAFVRYFKAPVILSTLGSLLLTAGLQVLSSVKPGADNVMDGNKLFPALIGFSATSMIAGILMLIALFILVMRLAGFTRAYLKFPLNQIGAPDYQKKIAQDLSQALETVRAHKGTLVKAWLTSTVIMIPLLFVWCACSAIVTGLTPEVIAQLQMPPEPVNNLKTGAGVALLVVGLILSNYSMAVLAMSTMLSKSVKEVTIDSLWLSIIASPALTIVSLLVSIAVYVITTPYAVPLLFQPAPTTLTIDFMSYAWQIWQGLSSLIVIPMSVAMLCEVLRDSVVPLES